MSKLWVFGCSISDLYDSKSAIWYWSKPYIEWKGYIPKHHSQIIANELGYELINLAVSSADNYTIFQTLCDNIDMVSNDDYVIIQWTQSSRFRLVNDNHQWSHFVFNNYQNKFKLSDFQHISVSTINEILCNRLDKKYEEEIDSWEKLIRRNIPLNNLIIWKPFESMYGQNLQIYKSVENINDETNGVIEDYHFSEKGQLKMAQILLDKIKNNKKNIL